ncbi:MAG: putative lipopolysaccharide heptosyltransferase III [Candidatus Methylomirabilales bacterium]
MRILVINLKRIGDVLLATPALHALKRAFPESRIWALVPKGTEEVLTSNPDLEQVLTFEREIPGGLLEKVKAEGRLLLTVRRIRPDLVLEMGRGDREAILGFLSGAKVRVGYNPGRSGFLGRGLLLTHVVPWGGEKHTVERYLDLVRALGVEAEPGPLRFFFGRSDIEAIDRLLREKGVMEDDLLITIHPTSVWFFKGWTDEGFAQVIDHLWSRYGAKVAVTSGPARREVEKARRVIGLAKSPLLDLAGKLTLKQLAALLKRSHLFLGVDSAPMHIAAAVGTPVVALFGPSNEQNWRPWGEGHVVLKKDLFCRPCGRDGCHRSKRSYCLELISPEEVLQAIEGRLIRLGRDHTAIGDLPDLFGPGGHLRLLGHPASGDDGKGGDAEPSEQGGPLRRPLNVV